MLFVYDKNLETKTEIQTRYLVFFLYLKTLTDLCKTVKRQKMKNEIYITFKLQRLYVYNIVTEYINCDKSWNLTGLTKPY